VVGFASYLWPVIAIEQRVALGPLHRFLGLAVYGTGMAAAAVSAWSSSSSSSGEWPCMAQAWRQLR
jgi:hypothetical protein